MYLRGLKSLGDDYTIDPSTGDVWGGSGGGYSVPPVMSMPSGFPTMPQPSSAPPTGSTDWTGVFKAALSTWGSVEQANAQVEATKARYASPYGAYSAMPGSTIPGQTFPYSSSLTPGYLPFPGATGSGTILGIPTMYVLLGVAAVAALMIAKS